MLIARWQDMKSSWKPSSHFFQVGTSNVLIGFRVFSPSKIGIEKPSSENQLNIRNIELSQFELLHSDSGESRNL